VADGGSVTYKLTGIASGFASLVRGAPHGL
jgi:hypothetical protein